MSLNDRILDAIGEMMVDHYKMDVNEVLYWEDGTQYGGYCDTCRYIEQVVYVTYLDTKNKTQTWTYDGTFADLMRSL